MKIKVTGIPFLLFSSFLFVSSSTFAEICCTPRSCCHTPGYFEIIAAGSLSQVRHTNSKLGITSSETDSLVQRKDNDWDSWGAQVGVGYVYYIGGARRFCSDLQWFPMLEPQINAYYSNYRNKGDVFRFGSPSFNELTYSTHIRSTRLMFDTALTVLSRCGFSTFVIGGLGDASSRVRYSDTVNSDITCDIQNINLDSKSNSHFVWELGAGLNYAFNCRVGVSAEYLYTDFGKLNPSRSGNTGIIAQPIISPANFNLHTQAVLLGLHVALG